MPVPTSVCHTWLPQTVLLDEISMHGYRRCARAGASSSFHPPTLLAGWPDADQRSRVVFITRDLPREPVEESWQVFTSARRDAASPTAA